MEGAVKFNRGCSLVTVTEVLMYESVLTALLEHARSLHPKEAICLLEGEIDRKQGVVKVTGLVLPPLATYGHGFSVFPLFYLPLGLKVVGTAHSHPSGNPHPSVEDLNNMVGAISVIVAYPYRDLRDVKAYNVNGSEIALRVVRP